MHIAEGILSATPSGQALLAAGWLAAAAGTAVGLKKLEPERLPQASLLSAAFFVVSLVQVPLGPCSVHLILSGLMGLVLGWAAFPAVLIALLLQAVLFSVGGITTLGINTVVMAAPAVASYFLFRRLLLAASEGWIFVVGFASGAMALILGASIQASILILAGKSFAAMAMLLLATHLPAAAIEGLVTSSVAVFLYKVRPEVFGTSTSFSSQLAISRAEQGD
jgi:cobalt/nickel transport system permease protein